MGRVQGVGFRGFVFRLAQQYHLLGEVWNGVDGGVGAVLQSENAGDLDRAIQLLKTGPGHVEKVETQPTEQVDFEGFSIGLDRLSS